jgi:hypothetical protein
MAPNELRRLGDFFSPRKKMIEKKSERVSKITMEGVKGMLLKPDSCKQAPKSSQRIAYLSVVLFVAGGGEQGVPQQDLSNGEGGRDNAKFTIKVKKRAQGTQNHRFPTTFLHNHQSYSMTCVSAVRMLSKGDTSSIEKSHGSSDSPWSSLKNHSFSSALRRRRPDLYYRN